MRLFIKCFPKNPSAPVTKIFLFCQKLIIFPTAGGKMINFWQNKKILVTGADGFLGKHLINNLIMRRRVLRENLFLPEAKELDLRNWENCQRAVRGQDIVIHLAAVTGGIEFHKLNPGRIFYDNIIMGVQLMEAARLEKIEKFTVVGSAT